MTTRPQGPNVKRLIIRRMSQLMVPPGKGFAHAMGELTKPGNLTQRAREATEWVFAAIDVVQTAPDNPYGDDDEAIAGEILNRLPRPPREKP